MNYLLDTHILLWWLNDDKKLKGAIRKVIEESRNKIIISVASAWEISIKHNKGKLPLKTTVQECFEISNFEVLSIHFSHVLKLDVLPFHHQDPFDRLLISQAKAESLTLITSDEKIWKYDLSLLKA